MSTKESEGSAEKETDLATSARDDRVAAGDPRGDLASATTELAGASSPRNQESAVDQQKKTAEARPLLTLQPGDDPLEAWSLPRLAEWGHRYASRAHVLAMVQGILSSEPDPSAREDEIAEALLQCSYEELARELARHLPEPDRGAAFGAPLLRALYLRSDPEFQHLEFKEYIEFLMEQGESVDARNEREETPLHLVREPDLAARLVSLGADLEARDVGGCTPLCRALSALSAAQVNGDPVEGLVELVILLLESRAKLAWTCAHRPLHSCQHPAIAEALLRLGAGLEETRKTGDTPLLAVLKHASIRGSRGTEAALAVARLLLARGANPRARNLSGETPLHWCRRKDLALLLTRAEDPVDLVAGAGTPLLYALRGAQEEPELLEYVSWLLERGANPRAATQRSRKTALHLCGSREMVELLARRGADVRAVDAKGRTPLHTCTTRAAAESLLGHGAALNAVDAEGLTPLHLAIRRADDRELELNPARFEVIESLTARGASLGRAATTTTPLHESRHSAGATRALLRGGAAVNSVDRRGETPLHAAVRSPSDWLPLDEVRLEVVRALLASGANPHARNARGETPLHRCADPRAAGFLLQRGGLLEARDGAGETPVMRWLASKRASPALIAWAIAQNRGMRVQNARGETPLHVCPDAEVLAEVLRGSCEVDARDRAGRTPLSRVAARFFASEPERVEMVRQLLAAGANARAKDEAGNTPLHHCRSRAFARLLLKSGAALDARNDAGETPLYWAVRRRAEGTEAWSYVEWLLRRGADPWARTRAGAGLLEDCDPEMVHFVEVCTAELWEERRSQSIGSRVQ